MREIADDWKAKGKTGNPKVINLYYDNPAGRDPLDLLTPHPRVGRSWWYPQAPHVSGKGRQDGPGPRLVRGTPNPNPAIGKEGSYFEEILPLREYTGFAEDVRRRWGG